VFINNVENNGDSTRVRGVNQTLESSIATKSRAGRKIMQWAVAPVKVQARACNRHQLDAVDAETRQISQAVDNSVESIVELFDLQLVNHQIV